MDQEQLKEITDGLGIADGKTLAETITEILNTTLNSYDKRKTGELEKQLAGMALPPELLEGITALIEAKKAEPDPDPDPEKFDVTKLPAAVRAAFEGLETANKNLQTQFDDERTAREERDKKLQEKEAQAAARLMQDAITTAAVLKEGGGLDPARMSVLLPYIKEQGLVRETEGKPGTYEMNTGELDPIHSNPIFKPLSEGMKAFAGTEIGKSFRAVRPGAGTPGAPGTEVVPPKEGMRTVESYMADGDIAGLRAAADAGTLDVGQTD
jgi:hypothetical protein